MIIIIVIIINLKNFNLIAKVIIIIRLFHLIKFILWQGYPKFMRANIKYILFWIKYKNKKNDKN
jgi:hypothetical protein